MSSDSRYRRLASLMIPERALDAEARAELEREDREINLSRARTWGGVLLAFQALLIWIYAHMTATAGAERLWLRDLARIQQAIGVGYLLVLLCVAINRGPARAVADRAGPLINLVALFFHALMGINAQRLTGSVGWYVAVLTASPYILRAPTAWFFGVFTVNSAILIAGLLAVQTSAALRANNVVAVFVVTVFASIFARMHRLSLVNELKFRDRLGRFNAELESRVEAQTRELRSFAMRLDEVLEGERRRLARELHDDLGQELTALRLEVEAMRSYALDERALAGLARMTGAIERSHLDVRAILESLRPRILDEEGIEKAILWLAHQLRERTGCVCALEVVVDGEPDPRVGLVAFRVAQESLTNVARHARAVHVTLSLKREGDELVLEIADDGAPRHDNSIEPGRGMTGMRERVASVGGALRITPNSPRGVLVQARLPLRPSPSHAERAD